MGEGSLFKGSETLLCQKRSGGKNAVRLPQQDLVNRKVDTFAVIMPKNPPKTKPVAPSYTLGTLENLLVKTNRVRHFLGGPLTKSRPPAQECGWYTQPSTC